VAGVKVPGLIRGSLLVQTSKCVEAEINRSPRCEVLLAVERLLFACKVLSGGFGGSGV
jgi:hypothetical protein